MDPHTSKLSVTVNVTRYIMPLRAGGSLRHWQMLDTILKYLC